MEKEKPPQFIPRKGGVESEKDSTIEFREEDAKTKFLEVGRRLSESGETFPFPGLTSDAYAALKKVGAEYPGYTTPIDTLMARFKSEGMKVVMSERKGNQDFFILPALSSDIESDSLLPRHLGPDEEIPDGDIRVLVVLSRILKNN